MNRLWTGVACAALLAGCGKVQEAASEKVAEKAIEAAASKDGVEAKVDLDMSGNSSATLALVDAK